MCPEGTKHGFSSWSLPFTSSFWWEEKTWYKLTNSGLTSSSSPRFLFFNLISYTPSLTYTNLFCTSIYISTVASVYNPVCPFIQSSMCSFTGIKLSFSPFITLLLSASVHSFRFHLKSSLSLMGTISNGRTVVLAAACVTVRNCFRDLVHHVIQVGVKAIWEGREWKNETFEKGEAPNGLSI